jgi:spore coat polysaccharide biosynthesis protein SpsF
MTAAIIQARMGSTRLPGKVLEDLSGKPLLWHVVERVRHATTLDDVLLATTDTAADDPVADFCARDGIRCFRGSEHDVLDRYYQAARSLGADVVVRVTADCPLIDPRVIDEAVRDFQAHPCAYDGNGLERTYPDGLDVEVFSFEALAQAWREADLASEREHVTPYIWKNPHLFPARQITQAEDLSALRWTVDEPEDLAFVRKVYEHLYQPGQIFLMEDVLRLLEANPAFAAVNRGFEMNEGYRRSIENDRRVSPAGSDVSK